MEPKKKEKGLTYKEAGVDIEAGNRAARLIKEHVKKTFTKDVLTNVGLFGGVISAEKLKKFKEPVLVASIDGVGTKVKVAAMMDKWDSVGKDIVNHSSNDILCQGAEPFFFLDYIAAEKLKPEVVEQIVKGMSQACLESGMVLIGGETAEMPGVYEKGELDIAGCIVGVMEKGQVIDGRNIREGDVLIGLPSNGLHTNGYSLARKVLLEKAGLRVSDFIKELGTTLAEALLKPHKNYVKPVQALMKAVEVKGLAHITGGGLIDNLPRILPEGLTAEIKKHSFAVPAVFTLIQEKGNVPEQDMYLTFNMGVGLVAIVSPENAEKTLSILEAQGEKSVVIGKVVSGKGVKLI